jgi:magnesium-transporting ATPase (P-type)
VGTAAALLCLGAMCIIGFGYDGEPPMMLLEYVITAITILAVAVPEGLPLAVTLSLAFSSSQMMKENNLVKTLDSCETMGSATTICSDKTGTLTCNRMTVRGAAIAEVLLLPSETTPEPLGQRIKAGASSGLTDLLATLVAVCTMDESYLERDRKTGLTAFKGNPTECALLQLVQDMGFAYQDIRDATTGRSLATLAQGKPFMFSSARKMMSWAVPTPLHPLASPAVTSRSSPRRRCARSASPSATLPARPTGRRCTPRCSTPTARPRRAASATWCCWAWWASRTRCGPRWRPRSRSATPRASRCAW